VNRFYPHTSGAAAESRKIAVANRKNNHYNPLTAVFIVIVFP